MTDFFLAIAAVGALATAIYSSVRGWPIISAGSAMAASILLIVLGMRVLP